MSVGIISHSDCLRHDMGPGHPESPERLRIIESTLKNSNISTQLHFYTAKTATIEDLKRSHTLLEHLKRQRTLLSCWLPMV